MAVFKETSKFARKLSFGYNIPSMKNVNGYRPVIGLEIHVELSTKSKMFCQCSANHFGADPNTQTCPVCLGMPGALPVPNEKAIECAMLIGKALNCKINNEFKFDRKHYFYPDLPKGYQISQYDQPIAARGWLEIDGKKFRITRVHLEEDTAKMTHKGDESLVDFNRSGVPLVEIVTEPDFETSEDAKQFLEELQLIARYLGVSDADMEKGSMRLEPNISVQKPGEKGLPPYKVELKNINSFNFAKRGIDYEIERQTKELKKGNTPIQETRGFDEKRSTTHTQRVKEEVEDYRYFPDPDIPPFKFSEEEIDSIVGKIPELPAERLNRFMKSYKLKESDAFILTRDKDIADYFELVLEDGRITEAEEVNLEAKIASLIVNKKIKTDIDPDQFVEKALEHLTPKETDIGALRSAVLDVIKENPKVVEVVQAGDAGKFNFLVGQVMQKMKGQADPQLVRKELEASL